MVKPRSKGQRGEREVAHLWRMAGYLRACPTPGSGGLRPYGAGDLSPWPGDIAFIRPWLCEVKFDEHVKDHSRGWVGSSFVRARLRELTKLADRHIIGAVRPRPVLFARGSFEDWRVFVPAADFLLWCGTYILNADPHEWVELSTSQFFELALVLEPEAQP